MVAIFTGAGTGFERGSGSVLGAMGLLGASSLGRGGDQVMLNAVNGNLLISKRDEFLVGRGPDAAISRTYNSLGNLSDDNGDNWRQSTDRWLTWGWGGLNQAGSAVRRHSGDGSETIYSWNGSAYVATDGAGAYDKLSNFGSGWTWTSGDGQLGETYLDSAGARIVERYDTSGNRLTYSYAGGKLSRVTTQDGGYVQHDWSGNNVTQLVTGYRDLTTGVDKQLSRTRYAYDGSNRLSSVTVDLSPDDKSIADGRTYTTSYTYHGTSKLVASIQQTDGSRMEINYDSANRVVSLVETVAAGVGRATTVGYGAGSTTITDAAGQVTSLEYNGDGSLRRIVTPPATGGAAQQTVQFAYTANGDLASVTDAAGNATSYVYDDRGNTVSQTDQLGNVVTRTYGARNELLTETRVGSDAGSSAAAHTMRYVYDAANRLRFEVSAEGNVRGYVYNAQGQVQLTVEYPDARYPVGGLGPSATISEQDILNWDAGRADRSTNQTLETLYDARGNIAEKVSYGSANVNGGASIDNGYTHEFFTYDQAGQLLSRTSSSVPAGSAPAAPGQSNLFLGRFGASGGAQAVTKVFGLNPAVARTSIEFDFLKIDSWDAETFTVFLNDAAALTFQPESFGGGIDTGGGTFSAAGMTGTYTIVSAGYDQALGFGGWGDRPYRVKIDFEGAGGSVKLGVGATIGDQSIEDESYGIDNVRVEQAAFVDDFENGSPAGWQLYSGAAPVSPGGKLSDGSISKFVHGLGGTGGSEALAKTFSLNPSVGRTVVDFEFLKLDSWDGEQLIVHLNGNAAIAFAPEGYGGGSDSASGTFTVGGLTGTYMITSSGEDIGHRETPFWGERIYRVHVEVDGAGSSLRLGFGATLDEGAANENFGIDNVRLVQPAQVDDFQNGSASGWWLGSGGAPLASMAGTSTTLTPERETFVYDGMGRVIASTDLNGGTTNVVFRDGATQTVVTLANGFVQTSTYDKAGALVGFTESGDFVAGGSTTYKYDQVGRVRMMTDASGLNSYYLYDKVGRKVADINHYGHVVEYRYDANDRLVATVHNTWGVHESFFPALADPNSNVELASMRPAGQPADVWTWQIYDREGRAIQSIDGDGRVTTYEYDASSRLVKTIGYANKLPQWQVNGFKGAAPLAPVLPDASANDSIARNFYDKDGRLVGALDGEGYLSRIVYDAGGQKVQEIGHVNATTPALRASGSLDQLASSVDNPAADRQSRYVYDGQGLLRFSIDGLGQVTEYVYQSGPTWTASGPVRQTIQYAGSIGAPGSYTYASVRNAINAAGLAANGANRANHAVYDSSDRLVFSISAEGAVVGYGYDIMGQVTRTVEYAALRPTSSLPGKDDMSHWAYANDANLANRITRSYYNDRGELRFSVDAEGYATRNDYDAEGRLTRTVRWTDRIAVGDNDTIATVSRAVTGATVESGYIYDAAGRVSHTSDGEGNYRDYFYSANGTLEWDIAMFGHPDESRTRYEYDAAGKVVTEQRAWGTAEQATTRYVYDGLGNLTELVDPNGNRTYRGYDKLGRMVSRTDAQGGVTGTQYNAFGDAVRTADARGNPSYGEYDKLGRMTVAIDAEGYRTETAYTVFGEVATVTRGNAATRFEYDRLGRVVKSIDAENNYEQYTLDAFGNRTHVRNKIGGVTVNAYDKRGLLIAETLPMNSADSWNSFLAATVTNRFEYDARGNRTRMIEADGLPEKRTTIYVYDRADRLIETRGDAVEWVEQATYTVQAPTVPTERIRYDTRGNVIETVDANGAQTFFFYDDLDRKNEQIDALGTMISWRYDAAGNLVHERRWANRVAWVQAGAHAWPSVADTQDRVTNHGYDRLNRMTSTTVVGVRTGRWDGTNYTIAVGDLTTRYDYDADGNLVRTIDADGVASHNYYDRLGRKVRSVDGEKYVTGWLYDAEGNVVHERRWAVLTGYAGLDGWWDPPAYERDRITDFTYDRNGRRLTETRRGVEAYATNANGVLERTSTDSTVSYSYNGLGQVTRKIEATAAGATAAEWDRHATEYAYDGAGRLITESRAWYTNNEGNLVRPIVDYYYNGLNDLTRTRQFSHGAWQGQRVTRYTYKAGGRLDRMIDSADKVFTHYHDVAGNLVAQTWDRQLSNLSDVHEAALYTRDLLGRVTGQAVGVYDPVAPVAPVAARWNKGDIQQTAYNVFGDMSARGINGLQEQFAYDQGGRVERSTAGDGVVRAFIYDGNGNQTAAIENLTTGGFLNADANGIISLATSGSTYALGARYVEGLNVTLNVYDRRGQALETRLAHRQLGEGRVETLVSNRYHDAFGDIWAERDARGSWTQFRHNTMGRLIRVEREAVIAVGEDGAGNSVTPTERYFYDQSGRLVGNEDANGYRSSRALLNGTGYGASEALAVREHRADGSVARQEFDAFGDLRRRTEPVGLGVSRTHDMQYDAMGRLTWEGHANGYHEAYAYDVLGQRIRHWDNYHFAAPGVHEYETTDYDRQGRVISTRAFGGDMTTTSYRWDGALTSGMGTYGGWEETVTHAGVKTTMTRSDVFGHEVVSRDMGGRDTGSIYDLGGRLIRREGPETLHYASFNTGLLRSVSNGAGSFTRYGYDQAGNRTSEYTERAYAVVQNAGAEYDKLGRLTRWSEAGNATAPAASVIHDYDAVGNIRHTQATTPILDQQGGVSYTTTKHDWYRFDAMNRVVTQKGALSGAAGAAGTRIVRGSGTDYSYDEAGQRRTSVREAGLVATRQVWVPYPGTQLQIPDPGVNGEYQTQDVYYTGERREDYAYDASGALSQVRIAETTREEDWEGNVTITHPVGAGRVAASYTNDLLGRNTHQVDWAGDGTNAAYDRTIAYNAKGQVASEYVVTYQGATTATTSDNATLTSEVVNSFHTAGGEYLLGAVARSTSRNWRNNNDGDAPDTSTTMSYAWWDGAVVASTRHDSDTDSPFNPIFTNSYNYNGLGQLTSVRIEDGRPRTVTYTNDMSGQVIRRDEEDARYPTGTAPQSNGDPHEIWYRYGGVEMGMTGNNQVGGIDDYKHSINERSWPTPASPGPFRRGGSYGGADSDFDTSLEAITSYEQGSARGAYTVRGGDTLQGIAANLWGDASLWYKLAEANGLTAYSALSEGQTLTIPAGVMKNTHNASTFKPYDAAEAIGDTSPTTPKPPKKANKCGAFGQILLVAVAVAVSIVTYGATIGVAGVTAAASTTGVATAATGLTAAFGVTGGAIVAGGLAGAAGSIVSQGAGLATGLQNKFSWKGVAMAAIGGGVGGGVGAAFPGGKIAGAVLRGAASNAITQGIGVATGLQRKFDWAGVAAAGVIGGITHAIAPVSLSENGTLANHVRHAVGGAASAIAGAATRSVLTGTSFGDNVIAVLPDVIGSTIGNMLANGVASRRAAPRLGYDESAFAGHDGLSGGGMNSASGTALAAPGVGNGTAVTPTAGADGGKVGGGTASSPERLEEIRRAALIEVGLVNAPTAASTEKVNGPNGYERLQVAGWALDRTTLTERTRQLASLFGREPNHPDRALALAALAENSRRIDRLDAIVAAQTTQDAKDFGKLYVTEVAYTAAGGLLGRIAAPVIGRGVGWLTSRTGRAAESAGARFGLAASNDYRATFFAANPSLKGQVVVHHAVEQQVLTKFPGVVSKAEINSLENLRGIPNSLNSDLHLSKIRIEWNRFYKPFIANGTQPTKAQLLQKATQIDTKLGSQFSPPHP